MGEIDASGAEYNDEQRVVLLFYKYFQNVHFVDPTVAVDRLCDHQKRICAINYLKGRVLVAEEGVNGTLSGRRTDIQSYINSLEEYREEIIYAGTSSSSSCNNNANSTSFLLFQYVDWKISRTDDGQYQEPFPDLKISIVKEIVSTGGLISVDDLEETGNHMTPEQFHEALTGSDSDNITLIDVRNTFEHNIGHFKNPSTGEKALDPEMVTFSSFEKFCQENEHKLQNRKVLMYCTGKKALRAYLDRRSVCERRHAKESSSVSWMLVRYVIVLYHALSPNIRNKSIKTCKNLERILVQVVLDARKRVS
jgi:UPF0176 protein